MSIERKTLTARSVLASTLLGLDPPVLPVGRLVATAGLFGITENTARTALSRMAAAGEVVVDDGRYRLTGRLLDRQRRQDEGRHPRLRRWNGRWRMAVVTEARRTPAERADLRSALGRLRLAEWREGVWLRPDNIHFEPSGVAADHCAWLTADLDDPPALWDLDGWAEDAHALLAELRDLAPDARSRPRPPRPGALVWDENRGGAALAEGFVLSAAVLRHLAADPLLPPSLLPRVWPGNELRSTYDAWDRAYRQVLATWHRAQRG